MTPLNFVVHTAIMMKVLDQEKFNWPGYGFKLLIAKAHTFSLNTI